MHMSKGRYTTESNNAAFCQRIFFQQLQSNFSLGTEELVVLDQLDQLVLHQDQEGLEGMEQEVLVTTILGIH